jgi:hypothetical protein
MTEWFKTAGEQLQQPANTKDYFNGKNQLGLYKEAHVKSDVDESRDSIHHTLGPTASQAAQGNHNHDGSYVKPTQDIQPGTLAGGVTGKIDCIKINNCVIEIAFSVDNAAIVPGNTALGTIPVGFRPVWSNVNNRYFFGIDNGSGSPVALYIETSSGELRTVLPRPAGSGTQGIITFAKYNG